MVENRVNHSVNPTGTKINNILIFFDFRTYVILLWGKQTPVMMSVCEPPQPVIMAYHHCQH